MNWLAHLFLSECNDEIRLGNLLADLVKGSARQNLNCYLQRGIKCHQAIDVFTDSHVIVHRSKQLISSEYRRFAGILIDIFYDHFLAKNWSVYSNVPLEEFTGHIYESFQAYQGDIPTGVRKLIACMAAEDWLAGYRSLIGVEKTLERISNRLLSRFNKSFDLQYAMKELTTHYNSLQNDFLEFFPELQDYARDWRLGARD
ncbi:ACP phosphodiesterase [Chlorogloeopsis fritschii PCC 9212]|uniref:ACP phosphodiesterase n=1 Tax=Chlorogloeopsis fritschii PCC 6912 TaxID=211165 RepID=A0A3S0ZT28_CHLFR|nr:ACP phosphodiesterase [Chlorogloeopsis fritschii]RUR83093.1 ACP phosphodiesterase [Chlorogloeopsis fritschii PCC 6912]